MVVFLCCDAHMDPGIQGISQAGPYPDRISQFLVKMTLPNLNPRTLQHVYQSGQISSWCKRIQRLWISLQVQILLINVSSGLQCTKNCQMKRCLQVLVPSIQFLLPPRHKISSDQTLPYIEVTSDMDMVCDWNVGCYRNSRCEKGRKCGSLRNFK